MKWRCVFFQAEDGIRVKLPCVVLTCFFFFQAEDGIRDKLVTGVQTCALPICRTVISDYLFEKDKIFAYLNLGDAELQLYEQYFELLAEQVPIPDLVIYLQAKPEALKKRIAKKNVPFEHRISDEYLEAVVRAYEHFFFHYKSSNLLVVETSEIDFVHRNEDLRELLERLSQPVKGTQYFLPLGSATADKDGVHGLQCSKPALPGLARDRKSTRLNSSH